MQIPGAPFPEILILQVLGSASPPRTSALDGSDVVNSWNLIWERLIFNEKKKKDSKMTKPQMMHQQLCRRAFQDHCLLQSIPILFKLNLILTPTLSSLTYAQYSRPTDIHNFTAETLKVVMQYTTTQSVVHGPIPVQKHLLPACNKYQN